eukprot:CAMPEP_0117756816 /NCGR_PEP_ID=MMETSP0947-20121206/14330_1 /TAXON_ID=44440 /ORGANISM="Chattonella subsalsa, Strain CCMP2191" /LENGTH=584 /DNA_ID=CAMNT_0005576529 /DNA_START=74 /DNA_END=1828 /DNA_ORIENTATION=+
MGDSGDFSPMQLLEDDLYDEDQETRVKAMRRVCTIAAALGPEQAREDLVPFLNGCTEDDDEILLVLAEELGKFVPLVGGPEHAVSLLEPLEKLAEVEETVVRDRATESICRIVEVLPADQSDEVFGLVKRLAHGDWFTARVSSCSLMATSYKSIQDGEQKNEIRTLYENLAKDDTPMVRRAAAGKLADFAGAVELTVVVQELLPIYRGLAADDQDSVRVLAIQATSLIASQLKKNNMDQDNLTIVLPVVRAAVEDRSWRVRHAITKDFFQISEAMGTMVTTNELLQCFNNLIQDQEAEVRAASLYSVPGYCDLVGQALFVQHIMPNITALLQDQNLNVRTALSKACMELAGKLGQEHTTIHIVPLLQTFLRDDSPEVRLRILNQLEVIAAWMPAIGETILPMLMELAHDQNWRVRKAVVCCLPVLAESMGVDYFETNLLDLYLQAYTDRVFEVRLGATNGLSKISKVCGVDWLEKQVLPRIKYFYENSNFYLIRITVVEALKTLAQDGVSSSLMSEVVALLVKSCRDSTPNVRFVGALALAYVASHADDAAVQSQIRPCLTELMQTDADADVKYFASKALESVG